MATTTFSAVIRSYGGDSTKTVTPAVTQHVVPFHIADPTAANTTNVARSSSDTRTVILPTGAIVTEIIVNAAATGGTNPTFDMGWIGVSDATALDVDGLVAEGDADAGKSVFNYATATIGDDVGTTMSTTQPVRLTGGVGASAPTGGSLTGFVKYHVSDTGETLT
jgi:hypothetical protein